MDSANYFPQTQILKAKQFALTLKGQGSGKAPALLLGDPNSNYFTVAYTSTGIWTLTTNQGYPQAPITVIPAVMQATGAGTLTIQESPYPSQNATTNAWTLTFNTFVSGSLSDALTGDYVRLWIVFCNSTVQI